MTKNGPLIQGFNVNNLNELTTTTNGGTLTVAGAATPRAVKVTVNSLVAALYGDYTFALAGFALTNGNNTFTAVANDAYGGSVNNTVSMNLPGTNNYSYDLNGNLLSDGNRCFAYDDENQLTSVWVTNTWRSDFLYDGRMRRRIRREYTWNGTWNLTNEVHYIYDGNLVIQERNALNLPQVAYTRGNDLSGSLQGAGGIGGLLALTQLATPTPQHYYYHSDGNGNVTMLTDANQLVAAKYEYDAYGNLLAMSGPMAVANLYRFSSKEWNANSELYYYLYRFYDPNLQRWLNRDPIEDGGFTRLVTVSLEGWADMANPFGFVYNDPTFGIDAQGLTIYLCSRKTVIGVGNHTYFYDSSAAPGSGCKSCGEAGSSGGSSSGSSSSSSGSCGNGNCPDNNEKGPNSPGVSCQPIPGSDGSVGQSIMNCCKNSINNGLFVPCVHDCHSAVNRCLQQNGYNPPNNPRFGPPHVGPISPR
jgi:RHS repeat-associated protein